VETASSYASERFHRHLNAEQGLPVSLAVDDLEHKLLTERRGGYCFEHNLLLKAAS
jgi:N-hydroxyarylamine O-acetyltransferase